MSSQILAQKERKLFSELLQAYEQKQLSKGRKIADQILKKHPQHGETMCMKGLVMVHLGEREAGISLIKDGMRKDLQSHICWHVWALVQKGEHNYEEALKSYTMALKIDKDNFNIIRETSILQTHTRQFDVLLESRIHMLRLRPYSRVHWIGVALAYKLAGNTAEARRYLDHMEDFLRNVPPRDTEYGELVFFHVRVLEELGEFQEALTLLDKKAKDRMLVDRPAIAECRARLFGKLKSAADADNAQREEWTEAAEQSWTELIDQNPDNQDYYKGFLANAGIDLDSLTDESRTKALGILEEFSSRHPKTNTYRRLALKIAEGDKFKELVKPYLERALEKGIPSIFSDVKNLYTDPSKLQSIQDIVEDIRLSVSPNDQVQPSTSADPTYYLWTLYFLAQHYSSLGRYEKALEILHSAMEHTPTLPELYMTKARVLKRAGDSYGAVRAMEEARKLDGQDRYVNTKSGKYRLRAGMINEADEVLTLFTKKGVPANIDLLDMQALHYLTEVGDTHRRLKGYPLALKMYYAIQKLFHNFREEQYDFHLYSLRRSMLGSYVAMLGWEDDLHSHPAYIHAAVWTARIWILLYDDPSIIKSLHPPEPSGEMSKKALNKAKKAARKATADTSQDYDDASSQKVRAKQNEDKGLEAPTGKDDDPEGLKLVSADDPLEQASKVLGSLGEFGKDDIDVNATMFDVAIRQKKYLKAARELRRAHARDPHHPEVHVRIVQLARTVASVSDVPEPVKSVLDASVAGLKPVEVSLEVFNSQYLQRHSLSASGILASAKVSQMLDTPREEVENLLFTTLTDGVQLRLEDALEILSYLSTIQSPRADEFRIACDARFTLSKVFKSEEEQAVLRRQCIDPRDENEVETVF
ncbi:NMDA receptor-regulated protein 1-domain-containing protein [Boletus reticuloceps]|uniref:NMDA receptor-regulated protein 1-domain-containing protein n=1 Tax=Boletus reticuloceps TaxID=495285 RepID=A0A8I2YUI8_9AGAM|nr:NMDA receptor-regulated protein 1-domain-containing protein [Boletus reticuloceps]